MTVQRTLLLPLLLACACAHPEGAAPPSGRSRAPQTAPDTGREFGITHHATLSGIVVGSAGQPLEAIEVVTERLADPGRGSMPQHRATSDRRGRFSLPAQALIPSAGDTARVGVVVVGYGRAERYSAGGHVPVDSTVVWVTLVPRDRTPPVQEMRLSLPIAPAATIQ